MSPSSRDRGFTLVELLVAIALMGIMMAIAVGGWSHWAKASAHEGAADEIRTVLRQAQQRAVTEGRAMCVWFDASADTYRLYRGACADAGRTALSAPVAMDGSEVGLDSPTFTSSAGTPEAGATFYARGTGTPGSVRVTRSGSSKIHRVSVEGLTGRVSLD